MGSQKATLEHRVKLVCTVFQSANKTKLLIVVFGKDI